MAKAANQPPRERKGIKFYADLATAIVTPLALIATVVTLIITHNDAEEQLTRSVKIFQSGTSYKALKDSRETAALYHDGKASEQDVYAVMQSIFLANSMDGLGNEMWGVFNADNCKLMADPHFKNVWNAENKSRYSQSFVKYMTEITGNTGNICGDSR